MNPKLDTPPVNPDPPPLSEKEQAAQKEFTDAIDVALTQLTIETVKAGHDYAHQFESFRDINMSYAAEIIQARMKALVEAHG